MKKDGYFWLILGLAMGILEVIDSSHKIYQKAKGKKSDEEEN